MEILKTNKEKTNEQNSQQSKAQYVSDHIYDPKQFWGKLWTALGSTIEKHAYVRKVFNCRK